MAEQLDIIDEDGATAYRHRLTGFIGRVAHGGHCAGLCVTERPGVGTIARMLASTWLLTLPGAEFVTIDKGADGVHQRRLKWVVGYTTDGLSTRWVPVNGSMLFDHGAGTVGTPLQSITASTASVFTPRITIPAGLLSIGYVLRVRAHLRKQGGGGLGAFDVRLGTAGTAADGTLFNITVAGVTPAGTRVDTYACVTGATTLSRELGATPNTSATDVISITGSNFDITQQMYLTAGFSGANTADTWSLINVGLYLDAV